jgi:hypothetical protein
MIKRSLFSLALMPPSLGLTAIFIHPFLSIKLIAAAGAIV